MAEVEIRDFTAISQLLTPLINLWTMFLTFYMQIYMLRLIFDLIETLFRQLRPPPLTS